MDAFLLSSSGPRGFCCSLPPSSQVPTPVRIVFGFMQLARDHRLLRRGIALAVNVVETSFAPVTVFMVLYGYHFRWSLF